MTDRNDVDSFHPDEPGFETLLREFYAHELRAEGVSPLLATRPMTGDSASRPARRTSGFVGLTLAATALAMAVLAFAPGFSGRAGGQPQTADILPSNGSHAGVATGVEQSESPGGPVELQGLERSGEPVRMADPHSGDAVDQQFPELDIRIIPIPDRGQPPGEKDRRARGD